MENGQLTKTGSSLIQILHEIKCYILSHVHQADIFKTDSEVIISDHNKTGFQSRQNWRKNLKKVNTVTKNTEMIAFIFLCVISISVKILCHGVE